MPVILSAQCLLVFSPVKIFFLICWVYVCMYSAWRVEVSLLIQKRHKPILAVFALLAGPLILFVYLVVDVAKNLQAGAIGSGDIFKYVFTNEFHRKHLVADIDAIPDDFIELMDASGKGFKEVYGQEKTKKETTEILDLTKNIILQAIKNNASDILIDPKSDDLYSVRFRIDGFLRTVHQIHSSRCNAVINSIKALSSMDIAEKRRPQDGSFMAKIPQGSVHFRVASSGVLGGEKLSLRILNQAAGLLRLDEIGLSENSLKAILNIITQPSGMVLVCGPTGSGKSTTLYAMLQNIDTAERNVITVEDPVEYMIDAASQIEVNVKAGITFASALRSILRQDPDVICVGEIRDGETAAMAMQASQTGHLVLATLHASSNMAAIVRLMDLGIKPLLLASAVSAIISQRLVRRLCDQCKRIARLNDKQKQSLMDSRINPDAVLEAAGCSYCYNTGYKGRTAVVDIMFMDDKLKSSLVNQDFSFSDLKNKGDNLGKSRLRSEGMKKVMAGLTTLEEVKRVTTNLG